MLFSPKVELQPAVPVQSSAVVAQAAVPAVQQVVKPKGGGITLQRRAADLLAAGDYVQALVLYEELLEAEPGNSAYRDIVMVLKGRAR